MKFMDLLNEVNIEIGDGKILRTGEQVYRRDSTDIYGRKVKGYATKPKSEDANTSLSPASKEVIQKVINYLKANKEYEKISKSLNFRTNDIVVKANGDIQVNFDNENRSITIPYNKLFNRTRY